MRLQSIFPLLFSLLALAGCRNDNVESQAPAPQTNSNPNPPSDPRLPYTGNYHFTVIDSSFTQMSGIWSVDTVLYDGYIRMEDSVSYMIRHTAFDSVKVTMAGNTDPANFFTNWYGYHTGGFSDTAHVRLDYIRSQSPSHTFWHKISGTKF